MVSPARKRLNREELAELDPRGAAEVIELILKEMIDEELLFSEAKSQGYGEKEESLSQVRKREEQIILDRLYREVILPGLRVEEEKAKAYYQQHRARFTTPEMIRVSHLLTKTEEEARQLLAGIRSQASFEELAKAKSADPLTALMGEALPVFWLRSPRGSA